MTSDTAKPAGQCSAPKDVSDAAQHGQHSHSAAEDLAHKQQMVERLFQHTNQFLRDHQHDPLLVVEALAAILVRYAALLGPVTQMDDRLQVLERLIGQEITQIRAIAKSAHQGKPDTTT